MCVSAGTAVCRAHCLKQDVAAEAHVQQEVTERAELGFGQLLPRA